MDSKETKEFALRAEAFPGFNAAERSSLEQAAIDTVKQELILPSDLDSKVPRLIEACEREAREVRKSIVGISSAQLRDARRSIDLLARSKETAVDLGATFKQLEEGGQGLYQHPIAYKYLRQLHTFRNNVNTVITWTERLMELKSIRIGDMLDNGLWAQTYVVVRDVQKIRLKVRETSDHRMLEVFEPYFGQLDVDAELLVGGVQDVLQQTVAFAFESVLEEDEMKLQPTRECLQICLTEDKHNWLRYRGDSARNDLSTSPLSIDVAIDSLYKGVDSYWHDELLKDVDNPIAEAAKVYEVLEAQLQPMLSLCETCLLGFSSDRLPVVALLLKRFHTRVLSTLADQLEQQHRMTSTQLIAGMHYTVSYANMVKEEGFTNYFDEAEVKMLDRIGSNFLTAAVEEMHDHMTDLARKTALRVTQDDRKQLPTGQLYTDGPVDLFHILQKNVAPITAMAEVKILSMLSKACVEAMRVYIETIRVSCSVEHWEDRWFDKDPNAQRTQWSDERIQALCAYCNDMSKIEESLEIIESKFATVLEADQSPFQDFMPELPDTTFFFLEQIADEVDFTMKKGWESMFSSDWNVGEMNPLTTIINTITEYFNEDFAAFLEEQWSTKLLRTMIPMITSRYITYFVRFLREKKNTITEAFTANFSRDISLLSEMWRTLEADSKAKKVVQNAVNALNALFHVMNAPNAEQFGIALATHLLDEYPDCPTLVIETIINNRTDVDKKGREALMQTWRAKIAYQERSTDDLPTTGWSGVKSVLGMVDKSTADHKTGIWHALTHKKTAAEREKEAKEKARQQARKEKEKQKKKKEKEEKQKGGKKGDSKSPSRAPMQGAPVEEETESLEALLARAED